MTTVDPRVERTRQVVCSEAAALLAADGVEAFTIEALAARSGVARSTIYRNWPDRADLLADTFTLVCDLPTEPEGDDFADRMTNLALALAHGLRHDAWGRLLPSIVAAAQHDDAVRRALVQFARARRAAVAGLVDHAVASGEIDVPIDVAGALERFVAPFFLRHLVSHEPIDEAFVHQMVDSVLNTLGACRSAEAQVRRSSDLAAGL